MPSRGRSTLEPAVAGEDDGLGPRPHADLVEHLRDVIAHGLAADGEPIADLRVAETVRDRGQDVALARRQRREGPVLAGGAVFEPGEREHDLLEARPGRLVL